MVGAGTMAEIEFVGYAGDCVVTGRLDVPVDIRLTDLLNTAQDLVVREAFLVAHADGHLVQLPELVLDRSELFAVEGRGSRGTEARRISTRTGRVELAMGPYLVRGTVHVRPGQDPLAALNHPRSMVPLTDVTMLYESGPIVVTHRLDALIVNRGLVDRIGLASDDPGMSESPRVAFEGDPRGNDLSAEMIGADTLAADTPHRTDRLDRWRRRPRQIS